MKRFLLLLCLLTLVSQSPLCQNKYPRPLENVDVSKIWHSTLGVIPEKTLAYDPLVADII